MSEIKLISDDAIQCIYEIANDLYKRAEQAGLEVEIPDEALIRSIQVAKNIMILHQALERF